MEQVRGIDRGSYIFGRSVHNIRIERLWVDVTNGFGGKWKAFFLELEHSCGLDADRDDHIWLIHHLFLQAINQDTQEWVECWNAHRLSIRGERAASPRELFMFGMVTHGPRGMSHVLNRAGQPVPPAADEVVDDLATYGVDWDALADPQLMAHHAAHNPGVDTSASLPFATTVATAPAQLSEVTCDPPRCPLTPEEVALLNTHLSRHFDLACRDMMVRRQLWVSALTFCSRLGVRRARATSIDNPVV
ncbi:hypothetical protein C8Q76DRAFT_772032 [Earliella scabrosa]|nr:hypothetical protein C8Q76DRAFT_772032 [Earliella scabrosa]